MLQREIGPLLSVPVWWFIVAPTPPPEAEGLCKCKSVKLLEILPSKERHGMFRVLIVKKENHSLKKIGVGAEKLKGGAGHLDPLLRYI